LEDVSDSDIFVTSVVPLQLYSTKSSGDKIILWKDPRPSSVMYCRPIRMKFKKETAEFAKEEISVVEESIKMLETTVITLEEQNSVLSVSHNMVLTLIDGKICNAVTSTSSAQVCYVCGAAPKQMNRIDEIVKRDVDITTYRFGLSTLHVWIRFLDRFRHISYRLEIKKWQVRGEEDQRKAQNKKETIQDLFKKEMGLLVHKVKSGGRGTPEDRNTARRIFFKKIIENLLESMVSTKILFQDFT
jgi:hypothetical protein